jgi:hypothetical protein
VFQLARYVVGREVAYVEAIQFALENVAALTQMLVAVLQAKPVADLGPGQRTGQVSLQMRT